MAEIKSIKLKIGKEVVEVSVKEAKALQALLNNTFEKDTNYIPLPYYPTSPRPYWEKIDSVPRPLDLWYTTSACDSVSTSAEYK